VLRNGIGLWQLRFWLNWFPEVENRETIENGQKASMLHRNSITYPRTISRKHHKSTWHGNFANLQKTLGDVCSDLLLLVPGFQIPDSGRPEARLADQVGSDLIYPLMDCYQIHCTGSSWLLGLLF